VTLRKVLLGAAGVVALALPVVAGLAWWALQPRVEPLPLPEGLVAVSEPVGAGRLDDADARVDYALLSEHFEAQRLRSYCGVASGVTVLNSLGRRLDQSTFFDVDGADLKSSFEVMFNGMTLAELAAFLAAHDASVEVRYADAAPVDEFRGAVRRNLQAPDDFMVVNYQREVLGQRRVGHISPVAAYDRQSDSVLILDTAAYNYPATWVPLSRLHAAMAMTDPASGRTRGFVEVSDVR
jgi:hypothetical protein